MMELKPEYCEVLNCVSKEYGENKILLAKEAIEIAVKRCQALADRPPKMLTDDEIDCIPDAMSGGRNGHLVHWGYLQFARAIEAAHIAKQSAPEVVPFNFAEWSKGGWIAIDEGGIKHAGHIFSGINYPSMTRES